MKTCSTCHVDKDESEYYARTRKCKECTKASVRANRLANLEYYQNYDRNRPNKDERAKKSIEYHRTEKGKEVRRKATKKYRLNSIKYAAHNDLNNAIKYGKITKPNNCECCGVECNPHGHHDDYNQTLNVRWLCDKCHVDFHNFVREKQRELKKQGLLELFTDVQLIKHVAKTYWIDK